MLGAMILAAALTVALAAPAPSSPPPAAAAPAAAPGAPAPARAPAGRVVEEIVAIVRNPPSAPPRVVTHTKLVEEARIALVSRGATDAAAGPLDRAALRAGLEWLLDQMLVSDEAAKLRLDDVDRDALAAEVRRFRERFPTAAAYERFLADGELTEDELAATLARMLRVERYIQSRVGRSARVGDDEVDRWLADRGARGAGAPARDAARSQLVEDRVKAQVREILAELRARADIRIVGQLGRRGGV
jgi:hypothetical protein